MGRVENIVGKGEKAGYQHFFLHSQCFQKASFSRSFKVGIDWKRVKLDIVLQKVKLLWNFPIETDLLCTKIGFGGGKNDFRFKPSTAEPPQLSMKLTRLEDRRSLVQTSGLANNLSND